MNDRLIDAVDRAKSYVSRLATEKMISLKT